jgi:hypothetical protein
MVDAGAILFTVLTAFLEIRHYIYRGDIYLPLRGAHRVALQVCGGLAMAIGLERIRGRTHSIVHDVAAQIIAGFACRDRARADGRREPVLGPSRSAGILQPHPARLRAAGDPRRDLGLMTRERARNGTARSRRHRGGARACYLSLEVRVFFTAEARRRPHPSAEGYTYSAVWLAFGVVLLIVGIFLRSQPVRLCSAAVVLLTVGKVFLSTWRAHRRVARALLHRPRAGAGRDRYLYQRLLFRKAAGGAGAGGIVLGYPAGAVANVVNPTGRITLRSSHPAAIVADSWRTAGRIANRPAHANALVVAESRRAAIGRAASGRLRSRADTIHAGPRRAAVARTAGGRRTPFHGEF